MKKITASQQKLLKTVHLLSAAVWLSCIVIITLLPLISKNITNGNELYMYNKIFHFIDMKIVTPAAVITLITGLVYSIFTKWGFFKHGWLIYKWVITVALILAGTFYLGPMVTKMLEISDIKRIDALEDPYYMQGLAIGTWVSITNTSLLIIAFIVSVYKPLKNIKK